MLEIIGIVALSVALGVAVSKLLTANLFWRSCDREFFPEAVRQFLISKEDDGELVFRLRGAPLRVWIRRERGLSEEGAVLTLVVPAEDWSRRAAERLNERFRFRGFQTHFDANASGDILGEVTFHVADIWRHDAGESAGWGARCVADALEVPPDARFVIDMKGTDSLRAVERLSAE
jgi:hypothetical protein